MPQTTETLTPNPETTTPTHNGVQPGAAITEGSDGRDPRQVRWNFLALMVDVTCFSLGMAFLDFTAVLPLLMERLGASGLLIGAFATTRSLAFSAVQIFVAYLTHSKPHQKPILCWIAGITRIPLLFLPWFLWHAGDSPTSRLTALIATLVILSLWALGDGLGYVPWMEIVARAFSSKIRGRFFASTQLASGIISVGIAALVVQPLLKSSLLPYPHNYAILTLLTAILMMISLGGIFLIQEPPFPAQTPPPRPPLITYFRRMPLLVQENPAFRQLAMVQLLLGFGGAAAPFYVLHAKQHFNLNDSWGGKFQVMLAIGVVCLMPAWTWLSEKRGPAAAVRGVGLACFLTPLLALTIGNLSPLLFGLAFLLMGGSLGWGMWIATNHYLLSHISEDERPIFVALISLLFAPSAFYPLLGGLLVPQQQLLRVAGVPMLFLLTTVVVGAGVLLSLRLPNPDSEG